MASDRDHEMAVAVLCILADHGISPDLGEVLLSGNPSRGIRPGALYAAMNAIRADQVERDAKVAEEDGNNFDTDSHAESGRRIAAAIRQKGSDHGG